MKILDILNSNESKLSTVKNTTKKLEKKLPIKVAKKNTFETKF